MDDKTVQNQEIVRYSYGKPYHVVALCYAKFDSAMPMSILKALVNNYERTKCKIITFSTCSDLSYLDTSDRGEVYLFDAIHMECFDAIIVLAETFKDSQTVDKIVSRATTAGVPVISVDKKIEGCYNINFCYGNSFEKIVRHVIEEHHLQRVNFIAGIEGNSFSEERLACYKKVMEENHIPIEEQRIGYGDFWEEPAKRVVEDFISSGLPFPQAIICANDAMAIAACQKLKEYGYRVPDDIIVTGFDGIELEKYHTPRLTTAEYNMQGLVDTIVQIVEETSKGNIVKKDYQINYILRTSCSCGCVPIEIIDMSDKIYQLAMENKDNEYFSTQAYRMVSHLSNQASLKKAFEEFVTYLRSNDSSFLWVCSNENMLEDDFDFAKYVKKYSNANIKPYEDIMHIILNKRHAKYYYGDKVRCRDIIPNMQEILEKQNYLLVLPLHAEEIPLGYIAACFPLKTMRISPYHALVVNFMHVLNNFRVQAERENYYSRDMLTNLYNRRGFYKNIKYPLENCVNLGIPFAVISIDMDGLKGINDFFGHNEGDFALHKISDIMIQCIQEDEYAARFGGDEFLIAFGHVDAEHRVYEIKSDMEKLLSEFNEEHRKDYTLAASYGVYIDVPSCMEKLDEFIKYADNAMYQEKIKHKRERVRSNINEQR